ncbi:flavodoxin family protein [Candidatus Lokiarchaeum ossiferum]|uniref:flavodoxin family protein n=1 Tax=Candidatus Lokiarchaeum ossiferum TaxID=2951803 RepID=UPI00352C5B4C
MEKIRVTAITSSPNRNGNSVKLARAALSVGSKENVITEEIYLPDYKLDYCHGCMSCVRKEKCVLNDDLNYIIDLIMKSDGIIMSAPTYGLLPNAMMLNFIQRAGMYNVYRSAFRGKYIIGISTAGGIGAKKTARFLSRFLDGLFASGLKIGILGVLIEHGIADKHLKKARYLGEKMVNAIENQQTYIFQGIFKKIIGFLFLKPIMVKNLKKNKDSGMRGVYQYVKANQIVRGI